eukprot:TRINITY_DN4313_c5_g1_i1.p1 TRINITY_DN4313_c5_g1~~TRINITY_DN4313_c5_g1_i1.p1  ORF type:complete len:209 (+),score=42.57 TRINITY_DN4313_c5_g1_i1:34-660(+)
MESVNKYLNINSSTNSSTNSNFNFSNFQIKSTTNSTSSFSSILPIFTKNNESSTSTTNSNGPIISLDLLTEGDDLWLPSPSLPKRIAGFVVFVCLGLLCSFLAIFLIVSVHQFAKFYTLATVFYLISTLFLVRPSYQLRSMFSRNRIFATLIYFTSIFGTLYTALYLHRTGATLGMVTIQFLALIYYVSSYIPFAQSLISNTIKSILC